MFDVEEYGLGTVIRVRSDIDICNAGAFDAVLQLAGSAHGQRRVVVSLEASPHCDSTGMSALVRAKKRLGAGLKIVVPANHGMRRFFELTNMTDHLRLHGTVAEALTAP